MFERNAGSSRPPAQKPAQQSKQQQVAEPEASSHLTPPNPLSQSASYHPHLSKAAKEFQRSGKSRDTLEVHDVPALRNLDIRKTAKTADRLSELPPRGKLRKDLAVPNNLAPGSAGAPAGRMIAGLRKPPNLVLNDTQMSRLSQEFGEVGGDPSILRFNRGAQTAYVDDLDIINVRGDVLPVENEKHPRSCMSSRAVLAHELGHRAHRGTKLAPGDWKDEFRASYWAARNAPGLNDEERVHLVDDAVQRAREANIPIRLNKFMRETLYGY